LQQIDRRRKRQKIDAGAARERVAQMIFEQISHARSL
jgi:hypothetical protein